MKKRFIAFYDALFFSIIAGIMWTIAILILISGKMSSFDLCVQNWYLVLTFAICIAVPVTSMFTLQKVTIDLSCDKVELIYLVNDDKNERDINTNWNIHPSEIQSVEVVKLSKEEKRKYTSALFLFSKYLKITMKYGNVKYVYISHYSNNQIFNIKNMLVNRHCYL